MPFFILITTFVRSLFKSQHQLVLENLALRQQVVMLRQSVKKPRPSTPDKLFWILFSRYVDGWWKMLYGLHPDTAVRWQRQSLRLYGVGKVGTRNRGGLLLIQPCANLSDKCSRRTSDGVLHESTGNCSSWVLRSLKRRSRSICCV
jgi:hypothetical protein